MRDSRVYYQRLGSSRGGGLAPTNLLVLCCAACCETAKVPSRPLSSAPRASALKGACVLTDVDDTIKSSGGWLLSGIALGGVDTSYSRGAYYPGVFQFQLELSMHGLSPEQVPHDIAILTARAVELLSFLEIKPDSKLCQKFRSAAKASAAPAAHCWGVGDVLYGSVQEWVYQERKGWRKIENFKKLRERRCASGVSPGGWIFIGDNGWSERDEEAVAGISASAGDALIAAFFHVVSDDRSAPPQLPDDRILGSTPVHYFRTYPGAARWAAQIGLLGPEALLRVAEQAERDAGADPANLQPGGSNEEFLLADIVEARAFASATMVAI
mmetsp:Transcript_36001/g.84599  ORF Transcript_36001/g.84599 Transcript_36001/m.84599 type:complete len:327 (+) Transcript_36001:108-1088(+)